MYGAIPSIIYSILRTNLITVAQRQQRVRGEPRLSRQSARSGHNRATAGLWVRFTVDKKSSSSSGSCLRTD